MRFRRPLLVLTAVAACALQGCRDPKIKTYNAPKDPAPILPGATATAEAATPAMRWQVPPGWQEQTGAPMRVGSFLITASDSRRADMAITTFPGDVGGDLENVNRWRGQIQLSPVTAADLGKLVQSLDLPAGRFRLVDLVSETAVIEGKFKSRLVAAWLKQPERTWFFKLQGEAELVASQRAAFEAFLRSVEFSAPAAAGNTATTSGGKAPLPAGHPPIDASVSSGNLTAPPAAAGAEPTGPSVSLAWIPPDGWVQKPLSPMRKGSFAIRGTNGGPDADLSIIAFPGAAGGLLDNINRWRDQVKLPPLAAGELNANTMTVESGPLRFTVVDFAGNLGESRTRIIGAVLPLGAESYFFKLMGPDALVASQKEAFVAFLKTVKTR
jgi:hypothetical protein